MGATALVVFLKLRGIHRGKAIEWWDTDDQAGVRVSSVPAAAVGVRAGQFEGTQASGEAGSELRRKPDRDRVARGRKWQRRSAGGRAACERREGSIAVLPHDCG